MKRHFIPLVLLLCFLPVFVGAETADVLPPTGTIQINNASSHTTNPQVTLSLNAEDESGVSQMMIGNEEEEGVFQFYATTRSWLLSPGDGEKTVHVRYIDGLGNESESFSATIILDTTGPVITINHPDTSSTTSKTLTASSEGVLKQSITTNSVCDGTLSFESYEEIIFDNPEDNGKQVCYQAVDDLGNTSYQSSNAVSGIVLPPTISSSGRRGGGGGGGGGSTIRGQVLGAETVSPAVEKQIELLTSQLMILMLELITELEKQLARY